MGDRETQADAVTPCPSGSMTSINGVESMSSMIKVLSAMALVGGLGILAIASTPGEAAAACRYENTDYQGPGTGTPANCLGGTCSEGWCCKICDRGDE